MVGCDDGNRCLCNSFVIFAVILIFLVVLPYTAYASGLPPVVQPISDVAMTPLIIESGKNFKTCGSRISFSIMATDPEGDSLSYMINSITKNGLVISSIDSMTLDATTGAFSWCVRASQVGEYDIRFIVKDCVQSTVGGERGCIGNEVTRLMHVSVLKPAICNDSSTACTFLKATTRSDIAGNLGDFYLAGDYDSATTYHASINVTPLPQLDFMDKIAGTDYSVNPSYTSRGFENRIFPGKVVIGNSSTAYTSGTWGGHARRDCMASYQVNSTYMQYINNTHMWYPEHLDHDEKDQHYAKIPYCSASQGSSGSELDEIQKFVRTVAAFKSSVKEVLRQNGLIIPTLQMIFRRTRVASDAEYLTGLAHPSAFDNYSNQDAMMAMAYGINANNIPPVVSLELVSHTYDGASGKDYFTPSTSEVFFETPASISLIYRGRQYTKEAIISARRSYDVNNKPLTYHWSVLRGNPQHVRITPLVSDASVVKIAIDYHPETTIEGATRLTNMVEVGAFVNNGSYYSAPGFVTSYSLNFEERLYSAGKIDTISYVDKYADPSVATKPSWSKDAFNYDTSGSLTGWTRYYTDGSTKDFDNLGHCVGCNTYAVSGRISYSGTGFGGRTVYAKTLDGATGRYETITDANGYFKFGGLPDGSYNIQASTMPTGYLCSAISVTINGSAVTGVYPAVNCLGGFTSQSNTCLARMTIGGRITRNGQPLFGITINATNDSGVTTTTMTEADGSYKVGVNSIGDYEVRAKHPSFSFTPIGWQGNVTVSSASNVTGINFSSTCTEWATDGRCLGSSPDSPRGLRVRR